MPPGHLVTMSLVARASLLCTYYLLSLTTGCVCVESNSIHIERDIAFIVDVGVYFLKFSS